jgi:hypothetical protein
VVYQHGDGVAVEESYNMEGEAEEIEGPLNSLLPQKA